MFRSADAAAWGMVGWVRLGGVHVVVAMSGGMGMGVAVWAAWMVFARTVRKVPGPRAGRAALPDLRQGGQRRDREGLARLVPRRGAGGERAAVGQQDRKVVGEHVPVPAERSQRPGTADPPRRPPRPPPDPGPRGVGPTPAPA